MSELALVVSGGTDIVRVTIAGELDIASAPQLLAAIDDLSDERRPVALDCAGVTFLDLTGLRALRQLRCPGAGRASVSLTSPSAAVRRVLALANVLNLFQPDEGHGPEGSTPSPSSQRATCATCASQRNPGPHERSGV